MPRMTGNRYFAEAVHAAGATHVFFVPTIMLPAMAEMIRPALEKALASNSPAVVEIISDVEAMAKRAWRP